MASESARTEVILEDIRSQNRAVLEAMTARFDAQDRRLDAIEATVKQRFDTLEGVVRGHGRKLDEHGRKLDEHGRKLESIEQKLDAKADAEVVIGLERRVAARERR